MAELVELEQIHLVNFDGVEVEERRPASNGNGSAQVRRPAKAPVRRRRRG
jgi:hypothetical protein